MKNRSIALFLMLSLSTLMAIAQSKDETAVAAAVEKLKKAMVDADQATLERIADNALSYGHSGGKIENKKEFVENIVNGNSDFIKIDLTEQTISLSGNTAIVRHKLAGDTHDNGKEPGKVNLSILTVWQKKGGEWKLLARQAVKI
jgi:ketosteroid isomerase-like protein